MKQSHFAICSWMLDSHKKGGTDSWDNRDANAEKDKRCHPMRQNKKCWHHEGAWSQWHQRKGQRNQITVVWACHENERWQWSQESHVYGGARLKTRGEAKSQMDGQDCEGHEGTQDNRGRYTGQKILEVQDPRHWPHTVGIIKWRIWWWW